MRVEDEAQVQRVLKRCMTVAELIAELQGYDEDAKVVFACDYGDHCHTEQALMVRSVDGIDAGEELRPSAYSQSGIAVGRVEDDEDEVSDDPINPGVIILRATPRGW